MVFELFSVIENDDPKEPEEEVEEEESNLIDFVTGDDLTWFDPSDPNSIALQKLSQARALGVFDYLLGIPGGQELLDAFKLLMKGNILLRDKMLADDQTRSCLNCAFYYDEKCTYFGVEYGDIIPCDEWERRKED